jgi:hypothetical protein
MVIKKRSVIISYFWNYRQRTRHSTLSLVHGVRMCVCHCRYLNWLLMRPKYIFCIACTYIVYSYILYDNSKQATNQSTNHQQKGEEEGYSYHSIYTHAHKKTNTNVYKLLLHATIPVFKRKKLFTNTKKMMHSNNKTL